MKKSLLLALVGILFFAFTSCSGDSKSKNESKEFAETKAYIQKFEKAFNDATSCEEVEDLYEQMETEAWKFATKTYEENEKITEVEEEALTKLAEKWIETIQKKVQELGCDEADEEVVEVEEIEVEE